MKTVPPAILAVLAVAAPALAQGHGNANGHYKSSVASVSAHHVDPSGNPLAGTGVRNFGSWLDDATLQDPGHGFVSFAVGLFKTPVYREVDVPSIDSGFAVNHKLQVGMTVPIAYTNAPGDPVARGVGDMYLDAKYQLRAPSTDRTGFAVIPVIEVLSVAPPTGGSRVQWALPLSAERQFSHARAMGTAGYFSRGVMFGAGAIELQVGRRAWVTGALSRAYSTRQDDVATALGFQRARTDLTGGLTCALRDEIALFASLGRTISTRDDNSATVIFSAGVSIGLKRPSH